MKKQVLKIDKNIPVPKVKRGRQSSFPFHLMKNGDSIYAETTLHNLRSRAYQWSKTNNKKYKWLVIKEKNGARIWRVK